MGNDFILKNCFFWHQLKINKLMYLFYVFKLLKLEFLVCETSL